MFDLLINPKSETTDQQEFYLKKIAIIRFSSFGDLAQALSVVDSIHASWGPVEIHWITKSEFTALVSIHPKIQKVWSYHHTDGLTGLVLLAKQIKDQHFDLIYDAHNNLRTSIMKLFLFPLGFPWLSRTKWVVRSKQRWKRFLLFQLRINLFPNPFIGAHSFHWPLEKFGVQYNPMVRTNWRFSSQVVNIFGDQLFSKNSTVLPLIALAPSAAWPLKRWPIAHWQQLLNLLAPYKLLLLGGPEDHFCQQLSDQEPERIFNLAGKMSFLETSYVIFRSRLVISADTGALHIADLFGRPAIALIGPTAFGFVARQTSEVLSVPLQCRPCTKDGRGRCTKKIYQQCMVEITPEQVVTQVERFLRMDHNK